MIGGRRRLVAGLGVLVAVGLLCPVAEAAPTVTEFTGGVTPGFSANGLPRGITAGSDGNIWFTERSDPGRVGRVTLSPHAVTAAAREVGASSARLAGTVCPNNEATSYRFEYGTTTAYGSRTAATNALSGTAPVAVAAALSALPPTRSTTIACGPPARPIRASAPTAASGRRPLGRHRAAGLAPPAALAGARRSSAPTGPTR